MQDVTFIILTYNEARHIERAIDNVSRVAKRVYVVDSYSTDNTVALARTHGAMVVQHEFVTQAQQFQWALDTLEIETEWVFRLDADEYLSEELIAEMEHTLPSAPASVNGYTVHRLLKFMGRLVTHGVGPWLVLRLFRRGKARVENRLMDEHLYLIEGDVAAMSAPLYDDSQMTLTEWTHKHNGYATREALDLLCAEYQIGDNGCIRNMGGHSALVRARKQRYTRLPLFWRSAAYFLYRYFLRLGFLDGREGFLWHFLQGWWYRTLADAKVYEIKKHCGGNEDKVREEVKRMLTQWK